MGKSVGMIARLALVLGILRSVAAGQDVEEITLEDVSRAETFFDSYLLPMAQAAYGSQSDDEIVASARKVARKLRHRGDTYVTLRIAKLMVGGGKSRTVQLEVLTWLEDNGILRWVEPVASGPRGGRPSPGYDVNPHLWPEGHVHEQKGAA